MVVSSVMPDDVEKVQITNQTSNFKLASCNVNHKMSFKGFYTTVTFVTRFTKAIPNQTSCEIQFIG